MTISTPQETYTCHNCKTFHTADNMVAWCAVCVDALKDGRTVSCVCGGEAKLAEKDEVIAKLLVVMDKVERQMTNMRGRIAEYHFRDNACSLCPGASSPNDFICGHHSLQRALALSERPKPGKVAVSPRANGGGA